MIVGFLFRLVGKLLQKPVRFGLVVLAGTAIEKELSKPPAQRTWRGDVGGVPYDFRPPSVERFEASLWSPGTPSIFVPTSFGLGWSINFARLAALLRQRIGSA